MDFHNQQSNVQRRLEFDDINMRDDGGVPREGGGGDAPLPGDGGVRQPEIVTDDEATDTEVSSGNEEGEQVPGLRILYQGYGQPRRVRLPHRGYVALFVRGLDGFTQLLSLPIGRIQLALEDDEEQQEGNDPEV